MRKIALALALLLAVPASAAVISEKKLDRAVTQSHIDAAVVYFTTHSPTLTVPEREAIIRECLSVANEYPPIAGTRTWGELWAQIIACSANFPVGSW